MSKGGVRHEQIGDDLYAIFVYPEGDHYRWVVTLTDMSDDADSHFGEILETGFADDEDSGWTRGKAALNRTMAKKSHA